MEAIPLNDHIIQCTKYVAVDLFELTLKCCY